MAAFTEGAPVSTEIAPPDPSQHDRKGELRFGPGARAECPHSTPENHNGRCNRFFWTVASGCVVLALPLTGTERPPIKDLEWDDPCRRCKRQVRFRMVPDQRSEPRP